MDRDILLHLPVLAAVARHRSFSAAAAELGIGPSAASHAVRLIERRLGTPIFARTTRAVTLTEAGEAFLRQTLPAIAQIGEAVLETKALAGRVSGVLRLNAPRIAAPMFLTRLLVRMAARHPDLTVEVTSEEALVDIVAKGYDAGIRLGEMIAEDMVAVRLTPPFQAIMVASPDYLARTGLPTSLAELQKHNCIGYRLLASGAVYEWDVLDQGRPAVIAVQGTARVSDPMIALDLALSDIGIAYLFEPLARQHLEGGRLVQVLPETAVEEPGLFLYFPRRASEASKLRAFIDMARV